MTNEEFDLNEFLKKELRRAFKRCPMYGEARRRAKEEYFVKSKAGKPMRRVRFKCAQCGRKFADRKGARETAVDHVSPVVDPETGFVNFTVYIERLFCSIDNLEVLCNYKGERDGTKSCHKIKSAIEAARRAEVRRQNKPPKEKKGKKK